MNNISVTTVVPVYAGKDFLTDLVRKLSELRDTWEKSEAPLELQEAIFVDDGSSDGSLEMLTEIQKNNSWVSVVNLSRNYGQHQATVAGILHSSGDWVVTLDEDLQHDPSLIDVLIKEAVTTNQDIIYANPKESVHQNHFRDLTSKLFKRLISVITGNKSVRDFNSFRLIRGTIARAAAGVCSHGTYFDIALCWFTDRVSSKTLPMLDVRFVATGNSGYTVSKLFRHARLLIMSSEAKVAKTGATLGLLAITASIGLAAKVLFDKMLSPESIQVEGWASLFLALLFSTGILTILLSIILEYISIIVLHIQGKPTFFVVNRDNDLALLQYFKDMKI